MPRELAGIKADTFGGPDGRSSEGLGREGIVSRSAP
jgi:hypothetical protein